jgi:RimJ/RimL family protein N-acetyltransferase
MDMAVMDVRPVTLEGRHVRLEPLSLKHHESLAAALDPTLLQWFQMPATNAAELKRFIAAALEDQAVGRALPFATIDKASGRAVGSTRFANIDRQNRHLEIGWTWIGRVWQRTAINTEAKLLMLTHAFEALGAIRVEFKTDALNTQSRTALARLGAVEEGYFRNHMITASGRVRHSVWFSIVEAEWPRVKRQLEGRLAAAAAGR